MSPTRTISFRPWALPARLAVLLLLTALPGVAQSLSDMTFYPVPPCTVLDTRQAVGAFSAGETRSYQIAGSGLSGQGGSASCNIPDYSNGQAEAQAVELLITAIATSSTGTGTGVLLAGAGNQPMGLGAMVTFAPGAIVTSTGPVALAPTGNDSSAQFQILVDYLPAHVLVRVVGYYARPVQTVWVHPVPGDAVSSGTALISAVQNTTGSTGQQYVVKLDPGIYDVGTTQLTMNQFVDIEGSGELATVIQGEGGTVVSGASSAELRDLQVLYAGSATTAVPILISNADTHIRQVTVNATGTGLSGTMISGIRISGGKPQITATTINITAHTGSAGIEVSDSATPLLRDVSIFFGSNGNGVSVTNSSVEMDNSRVQMTASGHTFLQDVPTVSTISSSVLLGGSASNVTCAGVWSGSVFYTGPSCP